jgi:PHD/YefM family antitoxin component YafN of YafNO toxin-antitoxin module
MAPISANALQKDLFKYLDKTIVENEILNVSTQNGNVIILNAEVYNKKISEMERLEELEAIRQSDDDIANGRIHTHKEVFDQLRARNKELLIKAGYNV